MKILVTGHRGFIGKKLFAALQKDSHEVYGVDLKDGIDLLHCLPEGNFDFVFHLAALPSVQFSIKNPFYSMHNNVLGTSKILEWSLKNGVKRVIFSSSAAVNDGNPKSPYGLQKYLSELECKLYSEVYNLDTVSLRYFNVYSEDQKFGGPYSTAISAWMEMRKQNKSLRLDGDGEQTRDFIHVEDIISANIFCMNYEGALQGKNFDIGTGKSITLNYVKNYINSLCNVKWDYAPARIGDIRHSKANIDEISSLGWSAKIDINEGLRKCFQSES
jgi:UDP-glucose 4-epimerase